MKGACQLIKQHPYCCSAPTFSIMKEMTLPQLSLIRLNKCPLLFKERMY